MQPDPVWWGFHPGWEVRTTSVSSVVCCDSLLGDPLQLCSCLLLGTLPWLLRLLWEQPWLFSHWEAAQLCSSSSSSREPGNLRQEALAGLGIASSVHVSQEMVSFVSVQWLENITSCILSFFLLHIGRCELVPWYPALARSPGVCNSAPWYGEIYSITANTYIIWFCRWEPQTSLSPFLQPLWA